MASSDDENTVLIIGAVGIAALLLYQKAKQVCPPGMTPLECMQNYLSQLWDAYSPFSLHPGPNPGLLPFGAGGTQGAGGTLPPTTGTPPQEIGAGTGGTPVCVNNTTGRIDVMNPDGTCPPGSTLTLAVNVTGAMPPPGT